MRIQRRLLSEVRRIRVYLGIVAGSVVLAALLIVAQAGALTSVIQQVFLARRALAEVTAPLLILLGALTGRALLIWAIGSISARAAATVKASLRSRLVAHLQKLGPAFTANERSGELALTIGEGVESVDAFFSQMLPQVCASFFLPLLLGLVVLAIDPLSGFILLVTTPILLLFLFLVGTLAEAQTKKQWKQLAHMSAHFLDVLQGLTTLKLFGRSRRQQQVVRQVSEQFGETTMRVLRVAFLSAFVLELGVTLSTALVAVEIGLRLLYSQISFAVAFFVLLLAPEFYTPLRALGAKFHASMSGSAAAQRIYEILDTPLPHESEVEQAVVLRTAVLSPQSFPPALRFCHVTYTYRDRAGDEHPALRDVSFRLEPGQKVALVGASGAGKSTLAHLLLRFIDLQAGEILFGGTSLSTIPRQIWREQIAWVSQRPYLFPASIGENICLGCANASREDVIEAARQADLHDFIQSLPAGYATVIGERGVRLSGGQAQRLALARVFLRRAPLLLLDEATAHLDNASEERLLAALSATMRDRMALIIAHRLHTLHMVDRIVLLEEGRVAAIGTHETLLRESYTYRRLFTDAERRAGV